MSMIVEDFECDDCGQRFQRLTQPELARRGEMPVCDRCFAPLPVADEDGRRFIYQAVAGSPPSSPDVA